MHPAIKFTSEKAQIIYEEEKKLQVLNFLDVNFRYFLQTNE